MDLNNHYDKSKHYRMVSWCLQCKGSNGVNGHVRKSPGGAFELKWRDTFDITLILSFPVHKDFNTPLLQATSLPKLVKATIDVVVTKVMLTTLVVFLYYVFIMFYLVHRRWSIRAH